MNRRDLLKIIALGSVSPQVLLPQISQSKNRNHLKKSSLKNTFSPQKNAHVLWYRQAAKNWKSALPVGNGRIGGLVKGDGKGENILINEESLWAGEPFQVYPEDFAENLKQVQKLVLEGNLTEANTLGLDTLTASPTSFRSYEPFAHLLIEMDHARSVGNYRRNLDMHTGIIRITYEVNGINMRREIFISTVDDLMAIKISANSPEAITTNVALSREENAKIQSDDSGVIRLDGQIIDPKSSEDNDDPNAGESGPGGRHMKFAGELRAQASNGRISTEEDGLLIQKADQVILLFSVSTDYNLQKLDYDRSINPAKKVETLLSKVDDKPWSDIKREHVTEHRRLFERVSINLGEPELEGLSTKDRLDRVKKGTPDPGLDADLFQYGRYLIMASSRKPGRLPANLQGIWNPWMWAPWEADFHLNINLQMNYWISNAGNLPETLDPFIEWFSKVTDEGEESAKRLYNSRGWMTYHAENPFGRVSPSGSTLGSQFQNGVLDPLAGAWMAITLWRHYEYTNDKDFLREKGYPILKGASEYLLDSMVEGEDGQLLVVPSTSPENSYIVPDTDKELRITKASTYHNTIVREIFHAVIQSSEALGIDKGHRQKVSKNLERIPDFQIGKNGTIQEWLNDYKEASPGHRHISHLLGLHPFAQISAEGDPELFQAAQKSIERRVTHGWGKGGWSNAWMTNCYARLKDGEKAYQSLQNFLKTNCSATLFDNGSNFQIESRFGSAAGIIEMLVQSYHRNENGTYTIELLPALPAAWRNGAIKGICTRGGFKLDMQWGEGLLKLVRLRNPEGNNCLLKYGEKNVELEVNPLESLELDQNLTIL